MVQFSSVRHTLQHKVLRGTVYNPTLGLHLLHLPLKSAKYVCFHYYITCN